MKKICLLLTSLALLLTSCSFNGSSFRKEFFTSDEETANARMDKVIEAIQNKDKDSLKAMFSKNAAATENFDEHVDSLFEFFKGEFQSYDDWGGPGTSMGNNADGKGHDYKSIQSTYDVETSEGSYRFAIQEFTKDTADNGNVGILSLYIIKAKDSDINFAYVGDNKWTPGINIEQGLEE